jgi:alpha-L-arabinofuranosidase
MSNYPGQFLRSLAALAASVPTMTAELPTLIAVDTREPGAPPMRLGVFFEDINYGADGGLYPERVKNRSFEFPEPLMGWTRVASGGADGDVSVVSEDPLGPTNLHYVRFSSPPGGGGSGLVNEGFFGMGVRQGQVFTFSVQARAPRGASAALNVELLSPEGRVLGRETVTVSGADWTRYAATLQAYATEPKARLRLRHTAGPSVDVDMVSLFPADTWKRRPNGLRADLVQWLAELQPAFVRFPGGCIVEGRHLSTRYQWKTTIGPLEQRKLIINRWNDEFKHRPAPDYFQSFGLGFFEYFQLCEDIGAEPLPILNCGMACQFNSNELVPLDQLDPYLQDALDLIEFANGPADSPWGSRRAQMGHPKPFGMRMLGVGNEQWGPQYLERYAAFARVLKAQHPDIQLVASAGPRPDDDLFQYLWPRLRELRADLVDEHCYAKPEWFFNNAGRYDGYDPSGPKVFMGEYAAQSDKTVSVLNRNNWDCALAEAAYLTGLERNSAVVTMSSYAPLFGHEEGWQWRPNLIWFDNLDSYGTPSYYVQQMFSRHRGDAVLPVWMYGQDTPSFQQPGLYATATLDTPADEVIVKVVNSAAEPRRAVVRLDGAAEGRRRARLWVLAGGSLDAENSLAEPRKVAPVESRLALPGPVFTHWFPPCSLSVFHVPRR